MKELSNVLSFCGSITNINHEPKDKSKLCARAGLLTVGVKGQRTIPALV